MPGAVLITAALMLGVYTIVKPAAEYGWTDPVTLGLGAASLVDGGYLPHIFGPMVLFGTGAGLAFPALMNLAMSGVAPEEAGLASGLANTTMQVGGALGLAVLATLSASKTTDLLEAGTPVPEALTSGFQLAFWIGAALVVAALLAAVFVLKSVPATAPGVDLDDELLLEAEVASERTVL
ncbi:hypothetical protein [Nocardia sp. NPDC052316]|uniref:hypothetical protein n=1 Tax=Nocardia sp. NPDC052316 TaxID=3364329 RepID=UPI0037C943AD